MQRVVQSIELYSDHGGSNKVYNVQIVEGEGGFLVNFQNGRRGGSLASGCKTPSAVNRQVAQAVFDKLVSEKQNGSSRYRVVGTGSASAATTARPKERSELEPMLASAIEAAQLAAMLADPRLALQEKLDGERVLIHVNGSSVRGINRLGFVRPLPLTVVVTLSAASIDADSVLDGELVGGVYHAFDLLRHGGSECTGEPFAHRHHLLQLAVLKSCDPSYVRAVPLHKDDAKRSAAQMLRDEHAEGFVLRRLDAPYCAGRSNDLLKFKFVESATVWVDAIADGKRSVWLAAYDEANQARRMGKVTIPPNVEMPPIGAIVEVQYLYAYPGTNALAQPVYRGERSDQTKEACVLSQLKYKTEREAA